MAVDPKPPPERGVFVNYFEIANSREEFLISLGQVLPGDSEPNMNIRLITTPPYAYALWDVLGKSLIQYQTAHGTIPSLES